QRRAEAAIDIDAGQTAGPLVDIDAGDADILRGGGPVVRLQRIIMIMRDTDAELADERRGEDAVVVDTGAVRFLNAGTFERALGKAACLAKDRRLEYHRTGVAEAPAEAAFVRGVVIDFHVEGVGVLGKRQLPEVIVARGGLDRWLIGGRHEV